MYQQPMGRFHCTVEQDEDGDWAYYVQDLSKPVGEELVEQGLCATEADAIDAVNGVVEQHSAVVEE